MKAAFATWNNRIAPVFDVARELHIVETESGRIVGETERALVEDTPVQKAHRLAEFGIETLICGAISRPMQAMVSAYGIRVIAFVAGDLRDIIEAWLRGTLAEDRFGMPGCCRQGRHRSQGMRDSEQQEYFRNMGSRGGKGRNQSSHRRGRMHGPPATRSGDFCVCPQCGHREPHERGTPCAQMRCPKCGVAMRRQ
jgi:predicted Fe-Mo cluster-binding NifX family protein